jgi:hypothetical protein
MKRFTSTVEFVQRLYISHVILRDPSDMCMSEVL